MKLIGAITFAFLVFLSPGFTVKPGLPMLRGEDLILLVFLVCLCVAPRSCLRKAPRGQTDKVTIAFAIMMGVAFLAICFSGLRTTIIVNDFMILPMLARYWLIYKFAQSLSAPGTRRWVLYALAVGVGVSAVIGIIQARDIAGMSGRINAIYQRGPLEMESLAESEEGVVSRIGGTHGDPRHYGYLLAAGLAICGSLYLYSRRAGERVLSACVAFACLIALVYSMSRTPLITTVIMAIVAVVVYQKTRGLETKTLVLWLLFLVLGAGAFGGFLTGAARERLFRTDTVSFQNSAHARRRDFMKPFTLALEDPAMIVIGMGPSKASMRTSGHNDVGWYFQRFGLPGLAFYLFLLWHGIRQAWRVLKRGAIGYEGAIHLASLLVLVQWSIFIMAENIFKDPQMMALNMFLMGLIYPVALPAAVRLPLRQRLKAPTALARPTRWVPWPRPQRPFALRRASRITRPWPRRVIRPRPTAPLPAHRFSTK
jgi:hypothetical protein